MKAAGVPEEAARAAIADTAEARRILDSMSNYDHDPSIARLLDMPYLNIHTPLDEIGRRRMADVANELSPDDTVGALAARLVETFGEFRSAATQIEVLVGKASHRLGRVVVSHAAGTNGGYAVAKAYFEHGVDTVVYIHCRPDEARRLEAEFGRTKSLVVTGHIASDSVGINPYLDRLRREGLDVTAAKRHPARRGAAVTLRVATYNVNSVRARMPILIPWLETVGPDVVALQETKVQDPDFPAEPLRRARLLRRLPRREELQRRRHPLQDKADGRRVRVRRRRPA